MKATKNQTVNENGKWKFFPQQVSEIFPIPIMKQWGRENLSRLVSYWADKIRKIDAKTFDYSLDLANKILEATHLAEKLARQENINLPLAPDLRPADWVKVGDNVIIRQITVKSNGRRTETYPAVVRKIQRSECDTLIDIYVDIADDSEAIPIEGYAYELCSAHIMRPEEVEYFRNHLDHLKTWMGLCGMHNVGFVINSELQDAIMKEFAET